MGKEANRLKNRGKAGPSSFDVFHFFNSSFLLWKEASCCACYAKKYVLDRGWDLETEAKELLK